MAMENGTSLHKMGIFALTLVTASNMMGSGVFMLPTNLAAVGSISIWGWVVSVIGVLALALVFAKSSLLTPRIGGIVAYASDAFGPFVGFQATLCYWMSAWIGNVALLVAGVGYLCYFFPSLHSSVHSCIASIAIMWAFVALACCGAKTAGRAQSFTAIGGLVVVLGVGIIGWFWFNPKLYFEVYNGTGGSSMHAVMSAASLALWGFLGVESAVVSTGQVKDPARTVPRATVLGLLIAAACYVASTSVIMGIVPHKELINSTAPFADAARYMFGSVVGNITSALSIIACFGSLPGWLILTTEAPRSGVKTGLFPKFFAELNKNDFPAKGLIFTAILMTLVLLMTASPNLTQQFQVAILLSVFASLMPYMYALVALPVIMIAHKVNKGPTFMFYTVLVVIGMAFCVFALLGSGSDSLYWGTLVMALTIPMYSFVAHSKHQQGEEILHMLSAEESA